MTFVNSAEMNSFCIPQYNFQYKEESVLWHPGHVPVDLTAEHWWEI